MFVEFVNVAVFFVVSDACWYIPYHLKEIRTKSVVKFQKEGGEPATGAPWGGAGGSSHSGPTNQIPKAEIKNHPVASRGHNIPPTIIHDIIENGGVQEVQ